MRLPLDDADHRPILVDLCVTTHNTLPELIRLLECLHVNGPASGDGTWRLHVADNGSTDGTVEFLRAIPDRYRVDTVFLNENIGCSGGVQPARCSRLAPFLAQLNADAWLSPADVAALMRSFDETGADIIGPKQRNEHRRITHGGIFGSNGAERSRGWWEFDPQDVLYRDRCEVVTIPGSAFFIRRAVWDALTHDPGYRAHVPDAPGAFLPTPYFYEETWCCYFARHRGYRVLYDGTVSIGHTWSTSEPPESKRRRNSAALSSVLFADACAALGIELAQ